MNTENYYARHPWNSTKFYDVPAARRVMDYLVENTTTYHRYVDGHCLSPGRIITTRRRICHDLGISLRDLVNALNRLDLRQLITRRSYTDSIDITITLHPDELTTPPTAETPPTASNEVGTLFKASAQPALTLPQSKTIPAPPAHSKKPKNPAPAAHSKRPLPLDRPDPSHPPQSLEEARSCLAPCGNMGYRYNQMKTSLEEAVLCYPLKSPRPSAVHRIAPHSPSGPERAKIFQAHLDILIYPPASKPRSPTPREQCIAMSPT